MHMTKLLKALGDETRIQIITLLLKHTYCVRALAKKLQLSESTISQHLKILRDVELVVGKRQGHFMHYDVQRNVLHELSKELTNLATLHQESCILKKGTTHSYDIKKKGNIE